MQNKLISLFARVTAPLAVGAAILLAVALVAPGVALAHALVLGVMVSSFGHISGGHFNPAVTISVWVAGKIETARAGVYIVAQLVGATAGAGESLDDPAQARPARVAALVQPVGEN